MKFKTKFTEADTEEYRTWFSFYPKRNKGTGFSFTWENNGYFDPRPQINTNVTTLLAITLPFVSLWFIPIALVLCFYSWGSLYIHLPFDTGRGNTAESITRGVMFYHVDSGFPAEVWFRNWKSFNFPWGYTFWKREVLMKDGWQKEERGQDLWDKEKWGDKMVLETHPYKYTLKSGETQDRVATVYQQKRYWRNWFKLGVMKRHTLEIEFNEEVGERSGSWKGGCVGCSYNILKGETSLQALRRMEKERKF
jgi:lipoprotein signal peptidase